MRHVELLRPDRLRHVERPFAWLPCSLLQGDLLRRMSAPAKLLYMHLALAADRRGLSYWGDQRICENLGLSSAELHHARDQLILLDMLAFDGRVYQLLSLPHCQPAESQPSPRRPHPSAIEPPIKRRPSKIPEHARRELSNILGRDFLA